MFAPSTVAVCSGVGIPEDAGGPGGAGGAGVCLVALDFFGGISIVSCVEFVKIGLIECDSRQWYPGGLRFTFCFAITV